MSFAWRPGSMSQYRSELVAERRDERRVGLFERVRIRPVLDVDEIRDLQLGGLRDGSREAHLEVVEGIRDIARLPEAARLLGERRERRELPEEALRHRERAAVARIVPA